MAKVKYIKLAALIVCAFIMCSCVPANNAQPSSTPQNIPTLKPNPTMVTITSTPEPTPEPTPELDEAEYARQRWHEMMDALYDCGWTALMTGIRTKDGADSFYPTAISVFREMIPYISDLISCINSGSKIAQTPFQAHPNDRDAANESIVTDEKYIANAMLKVLLEQGAKHPDSERHLDSIYLPDDAMRDYMRICFADYTDGMPLPDPKNNTDFNGLIDIRHEDGRYIFKARDARSGYGASSDDKVIIYMEHANSIMYEDKEGFRMCVVSISDPDHYTDAVGWMIYLVKNDEPDRLGINWRVEKIVRMPTMTNGREICDGN